MMLFLFGVLVGAAAVLLLPTERYTQLRDWFINQWQKVTKKR